MWLYVPIASTLSASAPEVEGSISASSWQCQALARSCSWRGKPSRPANWSARYSKVSWLRPLFGVMLPPSTAARGVAWWMASLAESRASLTASPVSASVKTTSEISGLTPAASSSKAAHGSSSSRTSGACSRPAARNGFGETFSGWALRLRADCSRRQRLAQAMNASASLSLRWPTPDACVMNDGEGPETFFARQERQKAMRGDRLDYATEQLWYTPSVPNGGRTLSDDTSSTGITPEGIKRQVGLENQARWWSTPRATDSEKGGPNQSFGAGGIPLPAQAEPWATPTASENANRTTKMAPSHGEGHGIVLAGQASDFSRQVHPTYPVGGISSKQRRSLNPLFVEWLMGWPLGWTLLAWTDFACSATALSLFKQLMRSELLRLGLPSAAPPQQLGFLL